MKKVKTAQLNLTKTELSFLRDLFSILLPPDGRLTVSKALALTKGTPVIEGKLWNKIFEACSENGVPVGDDSEDFFIGMEPGEPKMFVLPLNTPDETTGESEDSDEEESKADDNAENEAKQDSENFFSPGTEKKKKKKKK